MTDQELLALALAARERAYTPYSHFAVGAALLCEDGSVYTGCNVENAAFTPTCCAERTAVFKAVSEGKTHFSAIAVVGGVAHKAPDALCPPCGVCRQVLREFCSDSFRILLGNGIDAPRVYTLSELLPQSFTL